jgi:hypothetical protein
MTLTLSILARRWGRGVWEMEEAEHREVLGLELMPDQSREGPNRCRTQTTLTLLRQHTGFLRRFAASPRTSSIGPSKRVSGVLNS